MNTQGCPVGFATDETFLPALTPGSCEVDLNVYDGVMFSLLIFRALFGILVWYDWWARKQASIKRAMGVQDKRRWEQRLPFIPVVSTLLVIVWFLVILLVRFDQINASNGVTLLFWTVAFAGYGIYSIVFQRKVIRLGKRVIPLARAKLDDMTAEGGTNNSGSPDNKNNKWDDLASFDQVQVAILLMQFISQFVQLLCGLVLGLIFPGVFVWLQVAYVSEAVYILGNVFSLMYQLQRVYQCVVESHMDNATKGAIRKKFRSQQSHFIVIGCSGMTVNLLLTAAVFPSRWYTLIYWMLIEISVSSLAAIDILWSLCIRKKRFGDDGSSSKGTHAMASTRIGDAGPGTNQSVISQGGQLSPHRGVDHSFSGSSQAGPN